MYFLKRFILRHNALWSCYENIGALKRRRGRCPTVLLQSSFTLVLSLLKLKISNIFGFEKLRVWVVLIKPILAHKIGEISTASQPKHVELDLKIYESRNLLLGIDVW